MYYLNEKSDIIVVDVETTGVDPAKHAVVLIAVAVCDKFFNVRASKVFRLQPHDGAILEPKAFEVNGLKPAEVARWPLPAVALKALNSWLFANCKANPRFALWYCWGIGFDDKFLFKTYERAGATPYMRYTWLCMRGIATHLGYLLSLITDNAEVETKNVAKFMERLGAKFEGAQHDPLADVLNSIAVIRRSTVKLFAAIQLDKLSEVIKEQAKEEKMNKELTSTPMVADDLDEVPF